MGNNRNVGLVVDVLSGNGKRKWLEEPCGYILFNHFGLLQGFRIVE